MVSWSVLASETFNYRGDQTRGTYEVHKNCSPTNRISSLWNNEKEFQVPTASGSLIYRIVKLSEMREKGETIIKDTSPRIYDLFLARCCELFDPERTNWRHRHRLRASRGFYPALRSIPVTKLFRVRCNCPNAV